MVVSAEKTNMKKTILILTALASLTIAAQAQLKKPFIYWGWDFEHFGFGIATEYWWVIEEGGISYYGVVNSKKGIGFQTTFSDFITDTLSMDGVFTHWDYHRRPLPDGS
jgi:hypothetical protein